MIEFFFSKIIKKYLPLHFLTLQTTILEIPHPLSSKIFILLGVRVQKQLSLAKKAIPFFARNV